MRRLAGLVLPGSGQRARSGIVERLDVGVELVPGTLNVHLEVEPYLRPLPHVDSVRPVELSTAENIAGDKPPVKAWMVKFAGEVVPGRFVEIVSDVNLREMFGKPAEVWPSWPIEVTLLDG